MNTCVLGNYQVHSRISVADNELLNSPICTQKVPAASWCFCCPWHLGAPLVPVAGATMLNPCNILLGCYLHSVTVSRIFLIVNYSEFSLSLSLPLCEFLGQFHAKISFTNSVNKTEHRLDTKNCTNFIDLGGVS